MKKKGNTSDFSKERSAELRAVFFSQETYSTSDAAIEKIVKSPSSRFWVDPARARDVMSRMERDPEYTASMHTERQRMYEALFRRYREIRRQFPGRSKIKAVTMAIYSGAPEFYLSASRARRLVYSSPIHDS